MSVGQPIFSKTVRLFPFLCSSSMASTCFRNACSRAGSMVAEPSPEENFAPCSSMSFILMISFSMRS